MKLFWKISICFAICVVLGFTVAYLFLIFGPATQDEALGNPPSTAASGEWDADLKVVQVKERGADYASSGKLEASWTKPGEEVDHILLTATDEISSDVVSLEVDVDDEEGILTGLKSATTYTISVYACLDEDCDSFLASDQAEGTTQEEYWQIQGEGSSYTTADQVVENGSTLSYLLPYADWAPKNFRGLMKYYYNGAPSNPREKGGVRVARSTDGYSVFTEAKSIFPQQNGSKEIFAFQVVPLASGSVRFFFEASLPTDPQHITQIYSLDSRDGYVGEDFGEIEDGVLLIGNEENDPESRMIHARQHKVGYPIQDSWIWDESPGTFMILTGEDACGQTRDGLFYAVYDGERWDVEQEDDCPIPLVLDAHGPVIVHMGGDRYKVYYENYQFGSADRSPQNATSKPLRVMYADGGEDGIVDLEDWEGEEEAREVNFLWPDGSVLDDQNEEPGLGDHVIWLPDNDLETQVMYMNLGGFDNKQWKQGSAGLGMAVLVNP